MSNPMLNEFIMSLWETIYMVGISSIVATLIGLPLGIILMITQPKGILENRLVNNSLGLIVNATRSIPFIILLIAIVPLTRFIVGTSIGTTAAIVPLTLGAIPFIARIIENALSEVDAGLIETGFAMGASPLQIVIKILIPEAYPSIVKGITVVIISLVGYSAMAGAIGGGGLGDLAIRYGYQRFNVEVMIATVFILIALVQIIQWFGDFYVRKVTGYK
jgi:D-methionine transport system permease protein